MGMQNRRQTLCDPLICAFEGFEKDNAMTTTQSRPSATIYQFPVGGRSSLTPRRDETPATELSVSNVAAAALGSAWYHEAAIQDSKRAHEH